MTQGACLCGHFRYDVDCSSGWMFHCHCSICRKHHGAAFFTAIVLPATDVHWLAGEDEISRYESSPGLFRNFCWKCGSVLPAGLTEHGIVPAGNLLGDPGMRPGAHIWVCSVAPWYEIADDVTRYDTVPAGGLVPTLPPVETAKPSPDAVSGSCLCGDIAFEYTGEASKLVHCHCSRCRRANSAAHATELFAPADRFRWLSGAAGIVHYELPEADSFATSFCRRCGSKVPTVIPEASTVVVPAGALDTDPGLRPSAHLHTSSKASWFDISDELPQLEEGPS